MPTATPQPEAKFRIRYCANCQFYNLCLRDDWTDDPFYCCTAHVDKDDVWVCEAEE
jgi:hypothetical protein